MTTPRTLPWDWYPAPIPDNVVIDETAYLETSYSFHRFHSKRENAVVLERASSVYLGTTFDLGSDACVTIGQFSLINAAQLIIDGELHIGDHVFVAWGVVVMDTYRVPVDPVARQRGESAPVRPVTIESDCWIGFGASILPGAQLGKGSVVAARSVVAGTVDPHTVVAGNPAVPVGRQPEVPR